MLYQVTLVAFDIQTETSDVEVARRNAEDDARTYYADWNYRVEDIFPAGEDADATCGDSDLEFSVCLINHDDGVFTFDASIDVVVEAEDPLDASYRARTLFSTLVYGQMEVAADAGAKVIAGILEKGDDASAMMTAASVAVCTLPSNDHGYACLESILELEKRFDPYTPEDAKAIADIAASFTPQPACSI